MTPNRSINKPLSYAEKKAVLEQADPNERIRWGLHCPELAKIEKRVPLKCKEIELGEVTKIDNISYELVIKINFGKNPIILSSARTAGVTCDIDENGRRIWATQNIVGPGDIMLGINADTHITDRPVRLFTPYIEFRIDGKVMERVAYEGKTIVEAQRYMNTRLFGNRAHPIEVKRLCLKAKVLRLPEGVQFHVKELDLRQDSVKHLDNLMTILAPECLPLDYLKFNFRTTDILEYNHPLIRGAKTLNVFELDSDDLLEFFKSLRNKTILHESALNVEDHIELIEDWIIHPRDVGCSITFERLWEKDVEEIYEAIMQHFEYREDEEEDVFISINQQLELRFTAGDDTGESASELIEAGFHDDFSFFKMEVVPAGNVRDGLQE